MPYKTIKVGPEVALEYKGRKIYHTYKNDDISEPAWNSFFTTNPEGSENDGWTFGFDFPSKKIHLQDADEIAKAPTKFGAVERLLILDKTIDMDEECMIRIRLGQKQNKPYSKTILELIKILIKNELLVYP